MSLAPATQKVRILLAEDNDDLRALIALCLNEEADLECVATTPTLSQVGPLADEFDVDVAILDMHLRGSFALKSLSGLCAEHPDTRFIIHSGFSNPEIIDEAYAAGASAYLVKTGDLDDLVRTVRRVVNPQES